MIISGEECVLIKKTHTINRLNEIKSAIRFNAINKAYEMLSDLIDDINELK